MNIKEFYYTIKPIIPRFFQIQLRRSLIMRKANSCHNIWPIDLQSGNYPSDWQGWPGRNKFALVLTHDVDTQKGFKNCRDLMRLEKNLGFRSSFNFVPERYPLDSNFFTELVNEGFEVGVHGLYHDGKLYQSRETFLKRSIEINKYLEEWNSVGFRSPAMHHNLEWIHDLNIEYDASTFDTDPFEPQPDGVKSIFPFWVQHKNRPTGYIELPYTLPQDFTIFILMREPDITIWKKKLDWIAQRGGMALVNVHPDYINFTKKKPGIEEYPMGMYIRFLEYVRDKYKDVYWHVLPKDMAAFWKSTLCDKTIASVA